VWIRNGAPVWNAGLTFPNIEWTAYQYGQWGVPEGSAYNPNNKSLKIDYDISTTPLGGC